MIWKPATPGFLVTLTATIILVVVSFSVPYFKSVYFLQATYNAGGVQGVINIGTLGYCLQVDGNTTCTKPSVGYEFDPNTLLGNTTRFQIPDVVTKWITYALFLHVIALILAAISALFGLLAHIREFSMSCFSSCISGTAASVCLIAFIFDLVLFFLARTRVREIAGANATIGSAIWLTLAAWILLFISGCVYTIGRCCYSGRPRAPRSDKGGGDVGGDRPVGYGGRYGEGYPQAPNIDAAYAERMRMEAIKAEVERKNRQKTAEEGGLPAFDEYEAAPLTAEDERSGARTPYRDQPSPAAGTNRYGAAGAATGYVPANNQLPTPQPRRQASQASSLNNANRRSPSNAYNNAAAYNRSPQPGEYISHGGRGPSDYNQGYANSGYPPSQPSQQSMNAYPPRQPSLAERNIYDSAGLPAAGAAAAAGAVTASAMPQPQNAQGAYLRPDARSPPRDPSGSYGHHTQASSYHSAYSQQPYSTPYGEHGVEASAASYYNTPEQGYGQAGAANYLSRDPYTAQAVAYQGYPSHQQSYSARQPSTDTYGVMPNPYGQTVPSPVQATSPVQYNHPQSSYNPTTSPSVGGRDLNFVGVPNPQTSPSPPGHLPYDAQQQRSPTGGPAATSPRLQGWREEDETGAGLAGSSRVLPSLPDDAPPNYEDSNPSEGYRNEKATYRP